ncbi:tetratricopeptide repeat protein [Verrucomicrobiota bacterium]
MKKWFLTITLLSLAGNIVLLSILLSARHADLDLSKITEKTHARSAATKGKGHDARPSRNPAATESKRQLGSNEVDRDETPSSPDDRQLLADIYKGDQEVQKPSASEIKSILENNLDDPSMLVAAFMMTKDRAHLKEALKLFPNDPNVLLIAATNADSTEKRLDLLQRLKAADPDNALPLYLTAHALFELNDITGAIKEIDKASLTAKCDDYWLQSSYGMEEIYRDAGHSAAIAKAMAFKSTVLPHLSKVRELSRFLGEAYESALQSGDTSLAHHLVENDRELGSRLVENSPIIIQLVGLKIENTALKRIQELATDEETKEFSKQFLRINKQHTADIRYLVSLFEDTLEGASDSNISSYFDRARTLGEFEALRWFIGKQQSKK